MTTLATSSRKCPNCNKISRHSEIMSTNQFGPCDLDTRPAPMMRDTMHAWVQECPHCGYVGSKLTDRSKLPAEFFKSESYVSCDGRVFVSDLARKFYKLYLVKREEKDARNAFWSALEAAWASDDAGDKANALDCRVIALEQLDALLAQSPDDVQLQLVRLDVLRRTRRFDKVQELGAKIETSEELLSKIVKYEIALAAAGDDDCHTVGDVDKTNV